ncbi:MAG: hypothetical protein KDJ15_06325 [Alphaproteobacteria bacterium]|nr:hypothetical protein [Alphaproteobacteria bacterium]
MLDFSLPYHSYCEMSSGPVAEPLNVFSCIIFWIVSAWVFVKRDDESSGFHELAAVVLFVLGTAGMVWHATLDRLAFAFDIIALYMLMALVVTMLCNNVLKWPLWGSMATVTALIFASAWLKDSGLPWLPQQGGAFLPPLLFLAVVSLAVQTRSEKATVYLLSGAYALLLGLAARSLDLYFCYKIAIGLHFLWHIGVALFVVYVTRALAVLNTLPPVKRESPDTP